MKRSIFLAMAAVWLCGAAPAPSPTAVPSPDRSQEIRGVWISPSLFGSDRTAAASKIAERLSEYRRAGINTLILLVKNTSGYVFYPSRLASMDPAWSWDISADIIAEASRQGLTVHAWFCVFPEDALAGRVREHPEWLVRNKAGEIRASLNPASPEARAYAISLIDEFLDLHPSVRWIHLDYIRYPCDPEEPYFSYDAETRKLFQAVSGQDPAAVKAKDSGNPLWNRWIEWNGLQVTAFVRELRTSLAGRATAVRISAAVFPDAANAKVLIGQDWAEWAEQGLVDMLCPMLYTNDLEYFSELARRAAASGRGRCLVCPGIGIVTSHNQNTPEGMLAEVEASRKCGADGVVFFSGGSLRTEFLEKLRPAR